MDQVEDRARRALDQAKQAVGGPVELAKRLKIRPQAISQWTKVPSERVIAVEKATGVSRNDLRPDLYPDDPQSSAPVSSSTPVPA